MANKDDVSEILISFGWKKKDLLAIISQMDDEIEKSDVAVDIKADLKQTQKEIYGLIDDIDKHIQDISNLKLDTDSFDKYKYATDNLLRELQEKVENLYKTLGLTSQEIADLGSNIDLSKPVEEINKMVEKLLATNEAMQKIIESTSSLRIDTKVSAGMSELESAFSDLNTVYDRFVKGKDSDYTKKGDLYSLKANQFSKALREMNETLELSLEEMDKYQKEVDEFETKGDTDSTAYFISKTNLAKAEISYANILKDAEKLVDIIGARYTDKNDGILNLPEKLKGNFDLVSSYVDELDEIKNDISEIRKEVKATIEASKVDSSIIPYKEMNKAINEGGTAGTVKIGVKFKATRDLYYELDKKLVKIQEGLDKRVPLTIPVKLVVEGTPYQSSINDKIDKSNITESAKKAAKKSSEDIVVDIDKTVKKSYTNAMKAAEETAKESIAKIKETLNSPNNIINIKIGPPTVDNLKEVQRYIQGDALLGHLDISENLNVLSEKSKELLSSFHTLEEAIEKLKKEQDELGNTKNVPDYSSVTSEIENATSFLEKLDLGRLRENVALLLVEIKAILVILERMNDSMSHLVQEKSIKKLSKGIKSLKKEIKQLVEGLNTFSEKGKVSLKDLDDAFENINVFELLNSLQNIDRYIHQIRQDSDALGLSPSQLESYERFETSIRSAAESLASIIMLTSSGSVLDKSSASLFASVNRSLKSINSLDNVAAIFKGIKITKPMLRNIQELGPALETVANQLRVIDTANYFGFLNQLSELTANASALHDLAVVLSKTKNGTLDFSDTPTLLTNQFKEAEKYEKLIQKLRVTSNRYVQDYTDALDSMSAKIVEINKLRGLKVVTQENIDRVNRLLEELNEIKLSLVNMPRLATDNQISKLVMRIEEYKNSLKKMGTGDARKELDMLIQRLHQTGLSIDELKNIATEFHHIKTNISAARKEGTSFLEAIKNKLKYGWAQSFAMLFSFYDIIRYIREISETVTELNSNLIELAKVSNVSIGQLYLNFDDFNKIAKKTGSTINDIVKATADWSRMGYSLPDAEKLAEVAQIYKAVGDGISIDEANEYLISSLKGFNKDASEALHIIDVYNEVANNFAIDTAGIGEALERSAASLTAANTSLEESVALVTAANSVLQDPAMVGTTFKSLSARIRGAKSELEELGETEEEVLTTSKLRDIVKGMTGFDIMKSETEFKSIYQILLGIGKEWDRLSDIERASLGEMLAGKRNSNALYAVLQNIDTLESAYATAIDSEGSAMREHEAYMSGVQAEIDLLTASVEKLANTVMSSDFLKGAIRIGRDFVDLLDVIIGKLGAIPPIIGAIAGALSLKGIGIDESFLSGYFGKRESIFKDSGLGIDVEIDETDFQALNRFNNILSVTKNKEMALNAIQNQCSESAYLFAERYSNIEGVFKRQTHVLDDYRKHLEFLNEKQADIDILGEFSQVHTLSTAKNILEEYNQGMKNTSLTAEEFVSTVKASWGSVGDYLEKVKVGEATLIGLTKHIAKAKIAMAGLKLAAMATQMVLATFATWAVTKVIDFVDKLIVTEKEAIEAGEEARKKIDEITDSLKKQQQTIKDSAQRFAELSQSVDQLTGKNISLSDDDYKEFLNISNELVKVFPSLSHHYDENGQAIVDLTGDVDGIVTSLNNLLEAERKIANQEIVDKLPKVFEGAMAQIKDSYNQDLSSDTNWQELEGERARLESIINELRDGILYGSVVGEEAIASTEKQILEYEKQLNDVLDRISEKTSKYNKQISSSLSSYIAAWLYSDENWDFITLNEDLQVGIQKVINSFDWKKLNFKTWKKAQEYISDELLDVFLNSEYGEEVQTEFGIALNATTSFNNNEITFEEYNNKVKSFVDLINSLPIDDEIKKSFVLSLGFDFDSDGNIVNTQFNNLVEQMVGKGIDRDKAEKIVGGLHDDIIKALQDSEIDWGDVILNPSNLDKSISEVERQAKRLSSIPFSIEYDKSSIATATEGISEFQSLYQSIYEKMEDGKVGEELAVQFTTLDELGKKLGNTSEYKEIWNEFYNTLSDGTHSFEEMQAALNKTLTAYVNAAIDVKNFDKAQAKAISTQLQLAGVTKESADAYVQAHVEYAEAKQTAINLGYDFEDQLSQEELAFIEEAKMSELARQQLALYALEKQISNGLTIETSADCKNLIRLASVAGATSEQLAELNRLRALLASQEVEVSKLYNNDGTIKKGREQAANELLKAAESTKNDIEKLLVEDVYEEAMAKANSFTFDDNKLKSSSGSGGSGGKESDPWKEAYEKELAELDHLHEMGLISEIQYYEAREYLNNKYFKDREKYTEEYNKNLEDIYKGFKEAYKTYVDDMFDYWQKSLEAGQISFDKYCENMKSMLEDLHNAGKIDDETYYSKMADYYGSIVENYDKAINAAQRLLKKQIESLEKQKESIEKSYQEQIDSVQAEIKALKDANEERQKALDLQKALYELNRAENQRTQYTYTSDKGFVYKAKEQDIKNAQEEVEQTQYEMYISTLEKKIESLETEMENLTSSIDDQIDKLQDYSDRLGEVANKWDEAQEDMVAASIWGANWQSDILATNEELLSNFTNEYIDMEQKQADMAVWAANVVVDSYNKQIEALNKWKEALASAETTSGTSKLDVSKSSVEYVQIGRDIYKSTDKVGVSNKTAGQIKAASNKINEKYKKSNRRYGTGTDKALPGYHEIAENGDEIILDNYGNAYIAKGHQLHKFEGGEKVFNETETKELLSGKYLPIESILPNYSDMLDKITKSGTLSSSYGITSSTNGNKTFGTKTEVSNSINITIGDIHVTEVDNASELAKSITNKLPNALIQELNRK